MRRILSDRGIRQALDQRIITIEPSPTGLDRRIQAASLDICFAEVDDARPIRGDRTRESDKTTLPASSFVDVNLTECIDWGRTQDHSPAEFLYPLVEARSTFRRIGVFNQHHGNTFIFGNPDVIELGNFGPNELRVPYGMPIAQLIFAVGVQEPLAVSTRSRASYEKVLALDYGVEIASDAVLCRLLQEGYLEISNLISAEGGIVKVHASRWGHRMKTVGEGIDMAKISEYGQKDLFEPVDLSEGYVIKPGDHVVAEAKEMFMLSPHVALRFYENVWTDTHRSGHVGSHRHADQNLDFLNMNVAWFDPGYQGGYWGQPKWMTGRTLREGDCIGFGQAIFFENGVQRPYGSNGLNSHHQGKTGNEFL